MLHNFEVACVVLNFRVIWGGTVIESAVSILRCNVKARILEGQRADCEEIAL